MIKPPRLNHVCLLLYLCSGVVHDLLGGEIALVPHQQFVDALAGVPVDLLQPLLHVVEGLLVRHVVHHDDTVGAAIVARKGEQRSLVSHVAANHDYTGGVLNLFRPRVLFFFKKKTISFHDPYADACEGTA